MAPYALCLVWALLSSVGTAFHIPGIGVYRVGRVGRVGRGAVPLVLHRHMHRRHRRHRRPSNRHRPINRHTHREDRSGQDLCHPVRHLRPPRHIPGQLPWTLRRPLVRTTYILPIYYLCTKTYQHTYILQYKTYQHTSICPLLHTAYCIIHLSTVSPLSPTVYISTYSSTFSHSHLHYHLHYHLHSHTLTYTHLHSPPTHSHSHSHQ
jgi:hypothetical protein